MTTLNDPSSKKNQNIGEGGYGCVHRPSLECATKPGGKRFSYRNYVSKLLTTSHAEKEMREFVIIHQLDKKNEFHLGMPILCKPKRPRKLDVEACDVVNVEDAGKHPGEYRILLMKFGGQNLDSLCRPASLTHYLSTLKQQKTDRFWVQVHHLLKGLQLFRDHDILHHDLKPQNILFSRKKGTLRFIDFGLMRSKRKVVLGSQTSTNSLWSFHWSYPLECGLLNRDNYDEYKALSHHERKQWETDFIQTTLSDPTKQREPQREKQKKTTMKISNAPAFQVLFLYTSLDGTLPDRLVQSSLISSFFEGFNELIDKEPYDTVLDFVVRSVDVYGLGLSLQHCLNGFHKIHALTDHEFTRMSSFASKMYAINPLYRTVDIDALLHEYEQVLVETGALARLRLQFDEQHNTISTTTPPSSSSSSSSSMKTHRSTHHEKTRRQQPLSSQAIRSLANLNVVELETLQNPPLPTTTQPPKKRKITKRPPTRKRKNDRHVIKPKKTVRKPRKTVYRRKTGRMI